MPQHLRFPETVVRQWSLNSFTLSHAGAFGSSALRTILFFSAAPRLDYQPLFGRGARAPPRSHGWTREDSFVSLSQSDNRPQIFVGHKSVDKLSRQNIVNKMADDVELMPLAREKILGRLGVISTEVSSSYLFGRFSDELVTRHLQKSKSKTRKLLYHQSIFNFPHGFNF